MRDVRLISITSIRVMKVLRMIAVIRGGGRKKERKVRERDVKAAADRHRAEISSIHVETYVHHTDGRQASI